jgi:hypothetical protein
LKWITGFFPCRKKGCIQVDNGVVLGEKGYGGGTTRIYVLLIVPISRVGRYPFFLGNIIVVVRW